MLEWNDSKHKRLLDQAVGSVKFLADQRDLHQIALMQWICGKFTMADSWIDESYAGAEVTVTRELWLYIKPYPSLATVTAKTRQLGPVPSTDDLIDPSCRDIAVEVVRHAEGCIIRARWAEDLIKDALKVKWPCPQWQKKQIQWADLVTQYQDHRGRAKA
jgi:hypothetical protein